MNVVVSTSPLNVAVTRSGPTVTVERADNGVTVTRTSTGVAVQQNATRTVTVNTQSAAAIDDDPYLGVKRLREVGPNSSTLTYDGDGLLSTVAYSGAETLTYTYAAGVLQTITDGTYTTAFTYDGDGNLTGIDRS